MRRWGEIIRYFLSFFFGVVFVRRSGGGKCSLVVGRPTAAVLGLFTRMLGRSGCCPFSTRKNESHTKLATMPVLRISDGHITDSARCAT